MIGRPSLFTPDLAAAICQRISDGESLKAICADEAMPNRSTVQGWVIDDTGGFSGMYARAREAQAHAMADDLLEIADDGSNDWMERQGEQGPGYVLNGEHVQRSRLRSDTRKWLLSKMLPKVYGDKVQHTGDGGGEIAVRVTIADAGSEPQGEGAA